MPLSEAVVSRVHELIQKYPEGRQKSALIPALHVIQEMGNLSLTVEQMDELAGLLQIKPIEVY